MSTIIAVTNSFNDTVTVLPPSAHIEGVGQVSFHNNPRLEFDGATISRNFDHHIDFRITKNKLHHELLNECYNHYPRLKRRTQYLNVFQFNKGRAPENQITIPHYYMATLREGEHVAVTNFGIPNCRKVVIKEQLGARGSNQVVVPTNMLTTLLKHSKGKTLGEVKEMFPDLIYTDNSNWDMMFFDDPNDLFISELITNVKSEYRLLVGGDRIYGRERTIKAGPYPQANLEVDKFHTVQEVVYERIEDMFDESLVATLYEFVKFIDLPIGSVDLYSTTDGTWGIFEYSTQFAFHGANPTFIRDLLLYGVKKILSRNNDEGGQTPDVEPRRAIYVDLSEADTAIEDKHFDSFLKSVPVKPQVQTLPNLRTMGSPVSEAVVLFKTLAVKYILFINDFVRAFRGDYIPVENVTDLVSYSERGSSWYYEITAGTWSLVINHNTPFLTLLSERELELSDFLGTNSGYFDGDDYENLTAKVDEITELAERIANIHRVREALECSSITTHGLSVHLLSKITQTYNKLLKVLYPSLTRKYLAVSYSTTSEDARYTINSKLAPATVVRDEIYIGSETTLTAWITEIISDMSVSQKSEANALARELYKLAKAYSGLFSEDPKAARTAFKEQKENLIAELSKDD